jgi:hypothetical protein
MRLNLWCVIPVRGCIMGVVGSAVPVLTWPVVVRVVIDEASGKVYRRG